MSVFHTVPIGAACLLYAAFASAALASDSPPPRTSSPLQDAVRNTWKASPLIQAAHAELEAARARARAAAQPLYNPELAFDAENADVNRRTATLSLTLDVSGKRHARTAQGQAELQVSHASYELVRREVAVRWLKAWSAAALAARQSELGRRRLTLMQRFDALADQRLKVGDISSPERDLAGLALGEAQIQQASLLGNEAAAYAALRALHGDAANLSPALPQGLPPASATVPSLALDERPEVVKARAQQNLADASVQVARRARLPDPTVSLAGGHVRNGPINDRVLGVSVSIPLPVLNTGRADVDAASAEADVAAADMRSQEWLVRAQLQEAQARYDALLGAAKAFRTGRAAAFEERTVLLEKLWRAGEISTSDYLVQLKQSLDTALSGLELESRAWQAWFDYLAAAGRLNDWIDGRTQDALQ